MPSPRGECSQELEDSLRDRGVTLVVGSVIDLGGVARAKTVPVGRLSSFVRSGMGASPSWNVFCIDDAIVFTDQLGVEGDLRVRLDAAALAVVADGVAWAPGEFTEQDGAPSPIDTRTRLREVCAALAADGFEARAGCELEFALFDLEGRETPWAAYGLQPVLGGPESGFLKDLVALAGQAGLPVDQLHAEYGHRQFEVSLAPTDPVRAADHVVLARLLIGQAASEHGLRASFSPLSAEGANAANGAHEHFSLTRDGAPVFSGGDGPYGLTPDGLSATAGVLRRLPEFLGFYAGSVLSPHRLLPGHWSGAHLAWGLENREAAVRYCAATPGNPHGASLELKPNDASSNPYLSLAALLWSAHEGIRDHLEAPPPLTGNPLSSGGTAATLPSAQADILKGLAASEAARAFAGDAILQALLAVRHHELDTYAAAPLAEVTERFRYTWSI